MIQEDLEKIRLQAKEALENAKTSEDINRIRVDILGKKGALTGILRGMKDVSKEDRPKVGQMVNDVRAKIETRLEEAQKEIEEKAQELRLASETIDVTLPSRRMKRGHLHPNTVALREIEDIFIGMGYEVVDGPEVEKDYYNFEALNIPADHPAKDEQDTFYINGDMLLRTQTSGVQIHEMEKGRIPIRMIAPGRVYRADEVDATHSPVFHQVEGLVVDKGMNSRRESSAKRRRSVSVRTTSRSRSRPRKWTFPASSAAVRAAASAKEKAGSRSWAAAWFTLMYLRCAILTRRSIPDLLSASAWNVSPF